MHPQTLAIHSGVYKDTLFNSVTTPIYTSSTFSFEGIHEPPPFDYTRSGNPTRQALNENLVALDGGYSAFAVSSGMAAIHTVLMLLKPGQHVICGHEIYGGSYRLFHQLFSNLGIHFSEVDMTDLSQIEASLKPETAFIWLETPTNPLLNIVDIAQITTLAKKHNILTVVDNTFLSPILQQPLSKGTDIVVYSTTKYHNGHSDVIGGAIICKTAELSERISWIVNAIGVGQSPFDAWLTLRGIKTLVPRIELNQKNASTIAYWLKEHSLVKKVFYPGLREHPGHELAQKQQKGFGGMLSFELDLNKIDIDIFFKSLELFHLCASLGGIESLIEQPASMSHASFSKEALKRAGISPSLIRISAGCEHSDDLIKDLEESLDKSQKK